MWEEVKDDANGRLSTGGNLLEMLKAVNMLSKKKEL